LQSLRQEEQSDRRNAVYSIKRADILDNINNKRPKISTESKGEAKRMIDIDKYDQSCSMIVVQIWKSRIHNHRFLLLRIGAGFGAQIHRETSSRRDISLKCIEQVKLNIPPPDTSNETPPTIQSSFSMNAIKSRKFDAHGPLKSDAISHSKSRH